MPLLQGEAGAIPQLSSPDIWSKVTNCVLPVMLFGYGQGAFFPLHMVFLEGSSELEIINLCHKSELMEIQTTIPKNTLV